MTGSAPLRTSEPTCLTMDVRLVAAEKAHGDPVAVDISRPLQPCAAPSILISSRWPGSGLGNRSPQLLGSARLIHTPIVGSSAFDGVDQRRPALRAILLCRGGDSAGARGSHDRGRRDRHLAVRTKGMTHSHQSITTPRQIAIAERRYPLAGGYASHPLRRPAWCFQR